MVSALIKICLYLLSFYFKKNVVGNQNSCLKITFLVMLLSGLFIYIYIFGVCCSLFTGGFLAHDSHSEPPQSGFPVWFLPLGPVTAVCARTNCLCLRNCSFALFSFSSPKELKSQFASQAVTVSPVFSAFFFSLSWLRYLRNDA